MGLVQALAVLLGVRISIAAAGRVEAGTAAPVWPDARVDGRAEGVVQTWPGGEGRSVEVAACARIRLASKPCHGKELRA